MQHGIHPLAGICPLVLSARSHVVWPSIAAGITWRSKSAAAQSWAVILTGFLQAGGQLLLPGLSGSSPLAFHLREQCLGQRRGGADGAAGAARFLGWQSRLSSFVHAVQPPSSLHALLCTQWGPISPAACPCHTQWLCPEAAQQGRETEAGKETCW